MKRKHFKVLSLVLALVLTFNLVACNTDDGTEDPDTPPAVGGEEDPDDTGDDTGDDTETGEPLAFTLMSSIWGAHEVSTRDDGSNIVLDQMQKDTNTDITFQWHPADQYANVVTTTLASGPIPEVINGAGGLLIDEGAAIELDDLLAEHGSNILESFQDLPIEETKLRSVEDGKLYQIPFILDYPPAYAWSIRTDWLDQVNLDMPETWDDWMEVWGAFKSDVDNDGNLVLPYSGDVYSLMPIFGMNVSNRYTMMIDENNQWTLAPEHENFRTYLEAVREMYELGYLDPEFVDRGVYVNNNSLQDAVNAGLTGSTFTWAEITRTATLALQEVNPDAKLEGITPPVGPNGDSGIPARSAVTPTSVITIAAQERGIEADLVKFFDYVFSPEGVITMSYGVEGETYDLVDGVPVLRDTVGTSFIDAREAGLNFTPLAHRFAPEAYESLTLGGLTYEEADPAVKQFADALTIAEGHWFSSAPILNTDAYTEYGAELMPQLGTAIAQTVTGDISIDEFYEQYENLKAAGLQDILEQGAANWSALTGQ